MDSLSDVVVEDEEEDKEEVCVGVSFVLFGGEMCDEGAPGQTRPSFFGSLAAFSLIVQIDPYPIDTANGQTVWAHYAGQVKLISHVGNGTQTETLDWCVFSPSFTDNLVSESMLDTHYGARLIRYNGTTTVELPMADGGWRWAYVVLGLAILVVVVPGTLLLRRQVGDEATQ